MEEAKQILEIKELKSLKDYNELMDSLGKKTEEFNLDEKMKKVREVKNELDYKFMKRHGHIKLYLAKFKLTRYIKKQEKYDKLLRKYNTLHNSLSLAIASGFPDIKEHQEYLKNLAKRTAEKSDKFRGEVNNGNN